MNKSRLNIAQDLSLMGWNFCKKALKKIIHLFNAHMPKLTQIARSTVLHMQICFAWKSIWSCLKESRTALLLSPLASSHRAPFAVSSRVENIFTSSTCMDTQSVAPPCLRQLKPPWANMQISQAHTVHEQDKEPRNCLLSRIKHAIQGHRGNNYPLCEEPADCVLLLKTWSSSLKQKQWSVWPQIPTCLQKVSVLPFLSNVSVLWLFLWHSFQFYREKDSKKLYI